VIRLATRGSALAMAQARWVAERLAGEVEVVAITTSGDRRRAAGDKSRFVKEIEDALLGGEVDLAVHSAKDVPGALPDGLSIVGVPERADARDALCGAAALDALRSGAIVGTASVRRRSQLLALRPELRVSELRGNVDTRLRRLDEGEFDAVVLAYAGLARLGRADAGAPLVELVPAPGQGCLALEARSGDAEVAEAASALTDRPALICLTAERALVRALEASCHTPIGGHARLESRDELRLEAFVGLPDGSHWIRDSLSGGAADPATLGVAVSERLTAVGAGELLAEAERLALSA